MLHSIVSFIIVGITWISFLLFIIFIWLVVRNPIYYWDKVYDKCTPSSAKYRYVVRLTITDPMPSLETTNLSFDVLRSFQSVVKITFGPKQLLNSSPLPNGRYKICKLILFRNNPLHDITHVVVNHDGNSDFAVLQLEIQELNESEANIAYVNKAVKSLDAGQASTTQKFGIANRETRSIEAELKPRSYPTMTELVFLFFLAVNLIFLLNIYVVPYCEDRLFCHDYDKGLIASVYAGVFASAVTAVVFAILCLSFRGFVKKPMIGSQSMGRQAVRCIFLFIVTALGLTIGALAAYSGSNSETFPEFNPGQKLPHEIYWLLANAIAMAVFFLILVPIFSMIGYCIGFFSGPKDTEISNLQYASVASNKSQETKADADDYYKEMMQGKHKVKSISQYKGLKNQTNPTVQTEPSVQQTVAEQKKSGTGSSANLTTYGSSKHKSKSSQRSASAAGSSKKTSEKSSSKTGSQKASSSAGKSKETVKDPSQSKSLSKSKSTKKTGSQESIGTAYYQQIMAQHKGKVKSVSQY